MAVPKQKMSRTRSRKRRGADNFEVGSLSTCPQCGEVKLPHRVCGKCGFYNNKKVIEISGKE